MDPLKENLSDELLISQFDYNLPAEKIAAFPLKERDQSKLLVYKEGKIEDSNFFDYSQYLPSGAFIVFNNTRVVNARLHFFTNKGDLIEIFCLEPADSQLDVQLALQQKSAIVWKCLIGDLKKWKEEELIQKISNGNSDIQFSAKIIEKKADAFLIHFNWNDYQISFAEVLELSGKTPLPPYIKRTATEEDKKRYQNIFAKNDGSVAAPTAGLHFTERVFEGLKKKNISYDYLTLHIGAGTFKPVKTKSVKDHEMHSEQIIVEKTFLERLLNTSGGNIVAVGTTSLRTLESLYWLGLKISENKFHPQNEVAVDQWDPYTSDDRLSLQESIVAIINYLNKNNSDHIITRTRLMIVPGYKWKVVKILTTNFHQPKSTLIMLVAAFVGGEWRKIYDHALSNEYRFLSYGDGSLLFRNS